MRTRLLSLSAIVLSAAVACAQQEPPAAPAAADARRPFVRFVEAPDGGKVETLIATYRKDKVTVILFAALHMADAEFYGDLEKRFVRCDALLYELVADPDVRPYPGMDRSMYDEDLVTLVQMAMGRGLSLQFQDEGIDYRRDNFVHADMTNEEFDAAMEEAGTSLVGEVFGGGLPEVDREAEARQRRLDLVKAFRSGRGAHEMCLLGARLITEPDPTSAEPTVMIEGRNEKCLSVLEQQLVLGKKRLGIFYGAAHMEHMERRLIDGHGFRHTADEWVTAWDCSASRFPTAEKGLKRKRYRARRDLEKLQEVVEGWCEANPGETPTWDGLRAAQGGKLPGRADGVDPWGRAYVLRRIGDEVELRCLGSDGVAGSVDDLALEADARVWSPVARTSDEGRLRTAKHRADAYARAVKYYHLRNGRLPESLAQLVEENDGMRYLRKLERDPWGNAYVLRGKTQADFEIVSLGPDGKEGTADDISSRQKPEAPAKGAGTKR